MGQDPPSGATLRASPSEALRRALAAARRPQAVQAVPPQAEPPPARTLPQRTINATGSPFGRGTVALPLAEAAIEAVERACRSEPTPGPDAIGAALAEATGAGAALVLSDLPSALTLVLSALAGLRGDVVVARGELRETEDGLRVEALIRASGARLREAGAVNAVTAEDLRAATSPTTRVLLTVEPRAPGPADAAPPSPIEIGRIARLQGAITVHVSAGGALDDDELAPSVSTLLREGADVVLAPGDRLLGGSACGIVAGSCEAMAPILRLARTSRPAPDRMTLAALGATLSLHQTGTAARQHLPLWRLLAQDRLVLEERARRLAGLLADPPGLDARVVSTLVQLGGGILGKPFESRAVTLACPGRTADALAASLAASDPAITCRSEAGRLVLDAFMLRDDELGTLATAVRARLSARGPA